MQVVGHWMRGCEHAPGHKEAAEEEDAPALPWEAGYGNGQHGEGNLLTAAVPPKSQPAPSTPPPWRCQPGTEGLAGSSAGARSHGGSQA